MPTPFESLFAAAALGPLVGVHGQSLIYLPQGAPPRAITAPATEESRVGDGGRGGLITIDTLDVFVTRDSASGIADPQLGDGLRRAGDPEDRVFAFHGEKLHVLENSWTLRFVRERPYQVGGNTLA